MLKTNNDEVMRVGEVAKDLHNFGGGVPVVGNADIAL